MPNYVPFRQNSHCISNLNHMLNIHKIILFLHQIPSWYGYISTVGMSRHPNGIIVICSYACGFSVGMPYVATESLKLWLSTVRTAIPTVKNGSMYLTVGMTVGTQCFKLVTMNVRTSLWIMGQPYFLCTKQYYTFKIVIVDFLRPGCILSFQEFFDTCTCLCQKLYTK